MQSLHQRLNRQWCISLRSVVDQDIGGSVLAGGLLDESHGVPAHFRQLPNNLVIGFGPLLRRLIGHPERGQQPQHGEGCGKGSHALVLLGQGGHVGPVVVDVGDTMPTQQFMVGGSQ